MTPGEAAYNKHFEVQLASGMAFAYEFNLKSYRERWEATAEAAIDEYRQQTCVRCEPVKQTTQDANDDAEQMRYW